MTSPRFFNLLLCGLLLTLLIAPSITEAQREIAWIDGYPADPATIIIDPASGVVFSTLLKELETHEISVASVSVQGGRRLATAMLNSGQDAVHHLVALVPEGITVQQAIAQAQTIPGVAGAWPNHLLSTFWEPNDPQYLQYQTNLRQVYAEEAWEIARGQRATVAVIDTGYRTSGLIDGTRFMVDPEDYYDFGDDDPDILAVNPHGTHVANIIAQWTDNRIGVAGLAHRAVLMPLKIFSDSEDLALESDLLDAVAWAAAHGADVINMSLGGAGLNKVTRRTFDEALAAGSILVCAAGNGGEPTIDYPGAYESCLAVGSVNQHAQGAEGIRSDFSNYGDALDLVAPGEAIVQESWSVDDGTNLFKAWGTSSAAPHVAAAIAMMIGKAGQTDSEAIRDALYYSAQDIAPEGWDRFTGWGELNVYEAVIDYVNNFGQPPEAKFLANLDKGRKVRFDPSSSQDPDGEIQSLIWDFGDGTVDEQAEPIHRYLADGDYSVVLTVIDSDGLSDVYSSVVKVRAIDVGEGNQPIPACSVARPTGLVLPLAGSILALLFFRRRCRKYK